MATRTTALAVALVLVSFSLAVAVAPVAATDASAGTGLADTHSVVESCAADPPANFADPDGNTTEVVGWVDGYWYDEPLDIEIEDGLTEGELEQLSARTAARFEALRCLTVQDGLPPVDIVPREEFADNQQSRTVGNTTRLLDNAKFETTLTIDSQTDSVEVRQSDSAERVGGFYDFIAGEIVIVTDDPEAVRIDESVLAEELGHAIQDQHFDLSEYDRSTVDRDKGILGLIEGDVGLVVDEYLDACEAGEWSEPCLTDDGTGSGGGPDIANWGVYFEQIQPYSDGPSFIQGVKSEGGWEAVNDLYDDPPTSALHTTYPDTYGTVEPLDVNVSDRSTDAWERVVLENAPTADGPVTHNTLGISTIAGMFAAPGADTNTTGAIIQAQSMYNFGPGGNIDQFNPHEYAHPVTEGWRGDSLYTYTSTDNETATLWELAWADREDVETFVDSYEQLVDIRGGERVDGYAHTYTFDNETGYDIAVTLVPDGDHVTVVTAPTVEALTAIDQELELVTQDDDDDDGTDGGDDGTDDGDDGTDDSDDGTDDSDDGTDDGDDGTDDGDDGTDDSDDGTDDGDDGTDDGDGGTDDSDDGTDDSDDADFGLVVLTLVGTTLLAALAFVAAGGKRGERA